MPTSPIKNRWLWVLLALTAIAIAVPFDPGVGKWADKADLGDALRGELKGIQQYGQLRVTLIVSVAILLQNPRWIRQLVDWWLALAVTCTACLLLKISFGRVRPGFPNAGSFTPPWESVHVSESLGRPLFAWEVLHAKVARLWSMPSSHTAAAVVMTLFLARLYPRLTPLLIVLTVIVGASRVLLASHYPSDVIAGALLAVVIAGPVIDREVGQRLFLRSVRTAGDWPERSSRRITPQE